jgi:hypothetical protein
MGRNMKRELRGSTVAGSTSAPIPMVVEMCTPCDTSKRAAGVNFHGIKWQIVRWGQFHGIKWRCECGGPTLRYLPLAPSGLALPIATWRKQNNFKTTFLQ